MSWYNRKEAGEEKEEKKEKREAEEEKNEEVKEVEEKDAKVKERMVIAQVMGMAMTVTKKTTMMVTNTMTKKITIRMKVYVDKEDDDNESLTAKITVILNQKR